MKVETDPVLGDVVRIFRGVGTPVARISRPISPPAATPAEPVCPVAEGSLEHKLAGAPTILLIEDDPDVRKAMTLLLQLEHCAVISTEGGQEALRCLGEEPRPDLILLDLMMPGMCGWEFLELLQSDPALAHIPVVILSGVALAMQKAIHLPVATILQKPVRLSALQATLDRLLPGRRG